MDFTINNERATPRRCTGKICASELVCCVIALLVCWFLRGRTTDDACTRAFRRCPKVGCRGRAARACAAFPLCTRARTAKNPRVCGALAIITSSLRIDHHCTSSHCSAAPSRSPSAELQYLSTAAAPHHTPEAAAAAVGQHSQNQRESRTIFVRDGQLLNLD